MENLGGRGLLGRYVTTCILVVGQSSLITAIQPYRLSMILLTSYIPPPTPRSNAAQTMARGTAMYDQSSGQVFREWTLPRNALATGQPDHDWSRRCPYPHFLPKGVQGPRSLVDIATVVVANNIGQVTEQHVEALPPRVQWRVWRFLEAR